MDEVNEIETTRREITGRINCDNYDELCKLLTSRKEDVDYLKIKKDVLDISFIKTVEKIEKLQKNGIKINCTDRFIEENLILLTDGLLANLLKIYQSALSNLDDPNILGFINIFMFQCSIMFSQHEVYGERLRVRIKKANPYTHYEDIPLLEYLTYKDWEDYNTIKTFLSGNDKDILVSEVFQYLVQLKSREEYTLENIKANPTNGLFLVKYMKGYGSTKLIHDYLNRVCYVELVSETQYADGRCSNSIEYLFHDILHGSNFFINCNDRANVDIDEIKEFYTFLNQQVEYNNLSKENFDKIRVFIYYEIHEGSCHLKDEDYISIEFQRRYDRLFRFGDLLGLIPGLVPDAKTIRESKYIIPTALISEADINKASEYFRHGRELYNYYYKLWEQFKLLGKEESIYYGVRPYITIPEPKHMTKKSTARRLFSNWFSSKKGGKFKKTKKCKHI